MTGIYPINTDKFKECFGNVSLGESNVSQSQNPNTSIRATAAEQSLSELMNNQSQNDTLFPEIHTNMNVDTTPSSTSVLLGDITNVPVIFLTYKILSEVIKNIHRFYPVHQSSVN